MRDTSSAKYPDEKCLSKLFRYSCGWIWDTGTNAGQIVAEGFSKDQRFLDRHEKVLWHVSEDIGHCA